jgi:hypothetical protein
MCYDLYSCRREKQQPPKDKNTEGSIAYKLFCLVLIRFKTAGIWTIFRLS